MIVNVLFLTDSQDKDVGHYMPFRFIKDMSELLERERKKWIVFDRIASVKYTAFRKMIVTDKEHNEIRISIRYVEPRRIDGDQLVDLLHSGEVTYEQLLGELGLTQRDFNNERLIVVDTCYSGKPMVQYTVGHFMCETEMPVYLIHEAFLFERHGNDRFVEETAASADYVSQNAFFGRLNLEAAKKRYDAFCDAGRSLVERFDENDDAVHVALATILLIASAMLMTKSGKISKEPETTT